MEYDWVITGGCGFIGTNLIKYILEKKLSRTLTVVDNLSVGCEKQFREVFQDYSITSHLDAASAIRLIVGDITCFDTAKRVTHNADIVVHLAANTGVQSSILDPMADLKNNVIGTVNYLEASRLNNIKKFIFASSNAPLGLADPPIHEALPCSPISPYGASKLSGESYCAAYYGSYGLKTTALRFSNVYGPYSRNKSSVIAKFIRQAFQGEAWILNGGGEQTRDFLYIDDLVDALVKIALHNNAANLYQVATNEETLVLTLVEKLAKIMKEQFGIEAKIAMGNNLPGDVKRNYADVKKIKKEIQWEPKIKLDQGLAITCQWFKTDRQSLLS